MFPETGVHRKRVKIASDWATRVAREAG